MTNYQHERGWLDSEVWGSVPYDERSAWSWMIGEAAWKDCEVRVGNRRIPLQRGQLTSSVRFMGEKFQWGKNKVCRYLEMLTDWNMIILTRETESGTGQNLITICNYDRYQTKRGKIGTEIGTDAGQVGDSFGTEAGQTRSPSIPSNPSFTHSAREPFTEIYDEGSFAFPILATQNTAVIHEWLKAGVIPSDFTPEILKARAQGKNIRSWTYFSGGVMDTLKTRTSPLPEGQHRGQAPPKKDFHREMQEASVRGVMKRRGLE